MSLIINNFDCVRNFKIFIMKSQLAIFISSKSKVFDFFPLANPFWFFFIKFISVYMILVSIFYFFIISMV